jgi:hypothetical protein
MKRFQATDQLRIVFESYAILLPVARPSGMILL